MLAFIISPGGGEGAARMRGHSQIYFCQNLGASPQNKGLQATYSGRLTITACDKKARLTPGLRATAPTFKDGGCSKIAISRHLGYTEPEIAPFDPPTPKTLA